jgi:hypothetical protein
LRSLRSLHPWLRIRRRSAAKTEGGPLCREGVALHFFVYNFITRHGSLRMPPALRAKAADHRWTYEELVEFIDRSEAERKRGAK